MARQVICFLDEEGTTLHLGRIADVGIDALEEIGVRLSSNNRKFHLDDKSKLLYAISFWLPKLKSCLDRDDRGFLYSELSSITGISERNIRNFRKDKRFNGYLKFIQSDNTRIKRSAVRDERGSFRNSPLAIENKRIRGRPKKMELTKPGAWPHMLNITSCLEIFDNHDWERDLPALEIMADNFDAFSEPFRKRQPVNIIKKVAENKRITKECIAKFREYIEQACRGVQNLGYAHLDSLIDSMKVDLAALDDLKEWVNNLDEHRIRRLTQETVGERDFNRIARLLLVFIYSCPAALDKQVNFWGNRAKDVSDFNFQTSSGVSYSFELKSDG